MIHRQKSLFYEEHGFTLIESVLAVIIIGMLAVIAVPKIMSTDREIVHIAARKITNDMRYARSLAITNVNEYVVNFNTSGSNAIYAIYVGDGFGSPTGNPVKSVELDGAIGYTSTLVDGNLSFDSLGSASTGGSLVTATIVTLTVGSYSENISVIGVTGRVSL